MEGSEAGESRMKEKTHVTVVIALYRPDLFFLREQLKSVAAQTYRNMDVLLYDDCPEGRNLENFVRRCLNGRPYHYERGKKNLGCQKAFAYLTREAEGPYIAYCDQDDVWLPEKIEREADMLDRGYVLCTHDLMMIDRKNRILKRNISRSYPKFLCPEFHWHTGDCITVMSAFNPHICAQGMTILMRKAAAELLTPFPEGILQDRWLCMGAGQLGKCARIEEPLAAYRRHPHNSSGTFSGIRTRGEWEEKRIYASLNAVRELAAKFPDREETKELLRFAEARAEKDTVYLLRHFSTAPVMVLFETVLKFLPEPFADSIFRCGRGRLF
jgi:glycosyltransferase involved in cell wall biosynthesis